VASRSQGIDDSLVSQSEFSMPHRMIQLLLHLSRAPSAPGKRTDVMYFSDLSLENALFGDGDGEESGELDGGRGSVDIEDDELERVREGMISSWLEQCAAEDQEDMRWEEWSEGEEEDGDEGRAGRWEEEEDSVRRRREAAANKTPSAVPVMADSTHNSRRKRGHQNTTQLLRPAASAPPDVRVGVDGVWWSESAGLSYAAPISAVTAGNVQRTGRRGCHAPSSESRAAHSLTEKYSDTLLPPLPLCGGGEVVCGEEDVCRMALLALSGTPSDLFTHSHQSQSRHDGSLGPPQTDLYSFDHTTRRPFCLSYISRRTRLIHLSVSTLSRLLQWILGVANHAQLVRKGLEYLEAVQAQGEEDLIVHASTASVASHSHSHSHSQQGVTGGSGGGERSVGPASATSHSHVCHSSASSMSLRVQAELLATLRDSFAAFESFVAQLEMQLIQQIRKPSVSWSAGSLNEAISDTTSESQGSDTGPADYASCNTSTNNITLLRIYAQLRPWERLLATLLSGLTQAATGVDCVSAGGEESKAGRDRMHHTSALALLEQLQRALDGASLLMVRPSVLSQCRGEGIYKSQLFPPGPSRFPHSVHSEDATDEDFDQDHRAECGGVMFSRLSTGIMGYRLYASAVQAASCAMQRVFLSQLMGFVAGTSKHRSRKYHASAQFDWVDTAGLCANISMSLWSL
jgi:hypothetical protein